MTETFRTSIQIAAPPATVFPYFTEPEAMVQWIGDHAVLDATPGGEFTLDIQGIPIRGRYLEIVEHQRIVVSWGHAGSDAIPPGSTEVEFNFEKTDGGTCVSVEHRKLPETHVESHRIGWPAFLANLQAAVQ